MKTPSAQSNLTLSGGEAPLYQQIFNTLQNAILKGQQAAGSRLPSSRELAARLGVSRQSVSLAYEQLVAEGYAHGIHGSGTFVCDDLPETMKLPGKASTPARPPQKSKQLPVFTSGIPALDQFPKEIWIKLYTKHLRNDSNALSYFGHDQGYWPLRQAIAGYLNTHRGMNCDADQVLVLSGSQQGIELTSRCLLSEGDHAWIEDPSYSGTQRALKYCGIQACPIPVDHEGFQVETAIQTAPDAKLAIVTPSNQYPLGHTLSIARRLQLIQWANRSKRWILEDDYDSEFRYRGKPIQAMHSLDPEQRILYLGTFSKVMFTDLRIGYLVVPRNLIKTFTQARDTTTGNPPIALQATLANFINEGHFDRHIRRTRKLCQKRRDALVNSLAKHCSPFLETQSCDGGMHLVTYLKDQSLSDTALSQRALKSNLGLFPLSTLTATKNPRKGFILGFAAHSERTIQANIIKLAKLLSRPK